MHDVQLEDRLRSALRLEADAVPFTVTLDRLEWRLAERRRGRFTRRSLAGLAATLAIAAVAVAAILFAGRGDAPPIGTSPTPIASPTDPGLPDAETLLRRHYPESTILMAQGGEPVQGPMRSETGVRHLDFGRFTLDRAFVVVTACLGADQMTWQLDAADGSDGPGPIVACTGEANSFEAIDRPDLRGDYLLSADVPETASWRIAVALVTEPTLPPLGTPEVGTVVIDEQGGPTLGTGLQTLALGTAPAADGYELSAVCLGPGRMTFRLDVEEEPSLWAGGDLVPACDGTSTGHSQAIPSDVPVTLSITVDPATRWHVILSAVDSGPGSIPPPPEIGRVPEFVEIASLEIDAGIAPEPSLAVDVPTEAEDYLVAISCIGRGRVEVSTPSVPVALDCPFDGAWIREVLVIPVDRSFTVGIRAVGSVRGRVRVESYDWDASPNAAFVPPSADVSAGGAALQAQVGCGLSFELTSGASAVDDCGPSYPVMPMDRTLTVTAGAELELRLPDAWTVTGATGMVASTGAIITSAETARFAALDGCCDTGQTEPSLIHFRAPSDIGDWTVRLGVSAIGREGSYSVPYYLRLVVQAGGGG